MGEIREDWDNNYFRFDSTRSGLSFQKRKLFDLPIEARFVCCVHCEFSEAVMVGTEWLNGDTECVIKAYFLSFSGNLKDVELTKIISLWTSEELEAKQRPNDSSSWSELFHKRMRVFDGKIYFVDVDEVMIFSDNGNIKRIPFNSKDLRCFLMFQFSGKRFFANIKNDGSDTSNDTQQLNVMEITENDVKVHKHDVEARVFSEEENAEEDIVHLINTVPVINLLKLEPTISDFEGWRISERLPLCINMATLRNGNYVGFTKDGSQKSYINIEKGYFVESLEIFFWCQDSRVYTYSLKGTVDGVSWFNICRNRKAVARDEVPIGRDNITKLLFFDVSNTKDPYGGHAYHFKLFGYSLEENSGHDEGLGSIKVRSCLLNDLNPSILVFSEYGDPEVPDMVPLEMAKAVLCSTEQPHKPPLNKVVPFNKAWIVLDIKEHTYIETVAFVLEKTEERPYSVQYRLFGEAVWKTLHKSLDAKSGLFHEFAVHMKDIQHLRLTAVAGDKTFSFNLASLFVYGHVPARIGEETIVNLAEIGRTVPGQLRVEVENFEVPPLANSSTMHNVNRVFYTLSPILPQAEKFFIQANNPDRSFSFNLPNQRTSQEFIQRILLVLADDLGYAIEVSYYDGNTWVTLEKHDLVKGTVEIMVKTEKILKFAVKGSQTSAPNSPLCLSQVRVYGSKSVKKESTSTGAMSKRKRTSFQRYDQTVVFDDCGFVLFNFNLFRLSYSSGETPEKEKGLEITQIISLQPYSDSVRRVLSICKMNRSDKYLFLSTPQGSYYMSKEVDEIKRLCKRKNSDYVAPFHFHLEGNYFVKYTQQSYKVIVHVNRPRKVIAELKVDDGENAVVRFLEGSDRTKHFVYVSSKGGMSMGVFYALTVFVDFIDLMQYLNPKVSNFVMREKEHKDFMKNLLEDVSSSKEKIAIERMEKSLVSQQAMIVSLLKTLNQSMKK